MVTAARLRATMRQVVVVQFFPAWCYALPMTLLDIPLALWEALLWTAIPYFAVGYYKDAGRSAISVFGIAQCCLLYQICTLPVINVVAFRLLYTRLGGKIGICMVTAQGTAFQPGMVTHVGCHDLGICPYMSVCTQAHLGGLSLPAALPLVQSAFKQ